MAVVTALKPAGRDRIAVELDGGPWRVLPLEAVLAAGLETGVELDRPRARRLGRVLRRLRARDTAFRALGARDHTTATLRDRLDARGIPPTERDAVVETMQRTGLVDDERFARAP